MKKAKRVPGLTLEKAIPSLRKGRCIRRRRWHAESKLFRLDNEVFVRLPRSFAPEPRKWAPYTNDVLANDWEVVR